jgi:hypothetical protein
MAFLVSFSSFRGTVRVAINSVELTSGFLFICTVLVDRMQRRDTAFGT